MSTLPPHGCFPLLAPHHGFSARKTSSERRAGRKAGNNFTLLRFRYNSQSFLFSKCQMIFLLKTLEALDSFISLTPHIQPISRSCWFSFSLYLEFGHMSSPPSLPSWCRRPWSLALNDRNYLLADLPASALTNYQYTLYTATRVILLKY